MPYKNISELPEKVKNSLPEKAQKVFMNVVNSQLEKGLSEEDAFKSAWGALKNQGWSKDENGDWVKKMNEEDEMLILAGILTEEVVNFRDMLTTVMEDLGFSIKNRTSKETTYHKNNKDLMVHELYKVKVKLDKNSSSSDRIEKVIEDKNLLDGETTSAHFNAKVRGLNIEVSWTTKDSKIIRVSYK